MSALAATPTTLMGTRGLVWQSMEKPAATVFIINQETVSSHTGPIEDVCEIINRLLGLGLDLCCSEEDEIADYCDVSTLVPEAMVMERLRASADAS
jgi:hypothetical protein